MSIANRIDTQAKILAEQYGVNASAARSLLTYIEHNISINPDLLKIITSGTPEEKAAVFRAGVIAWNKNSQAFFTELLENKTDNAKKYRAVIAQEVFKNAQERTA